MSKNGDPLELARAALADQRAWLVGGALRDRVLDRPTLDLDLVVDGDPRAAARAVARAASTPAASFALSDIHGGWRVVARDGEWQIDIERLRGDSLEQDLALRDFTINAIAEPIAADAGGRRELIDPLGGLEDLEQGRLRAAGPGAFVDDPLRVLRMVRIAVELDLEPDPDTLRAAHEQATELRSVSAERIFAELCRVLHAPKATHGVRLMGEVGATAVVLPELETLRGVQQSHYHHLDVYEHTLEVLDQVAALQRHPEAVLEDQRHGAELAALLAEPLANGLTRGDALRWGALLHDIAKPPTREVRDPGGRATFRGHDHQGAELAHSLLARLRASGRLQDHVAALVRHHLRLGFLVHEPQPLARATVYAYLRTCEPVEVDVTLLSVADRLAGRVSPGFGRGERAQQSIEAHLRLARAMLDDALRWRASGGSPRALWRGDELARELGIAQGPLVGELLERLTEAQYTGEVATRAQGLEHARQRLADVNRAPRDPDRPPGTLDEGSP